MAWRLPFYIFIGFLNFLSKIENRFRWLQTVLLREMGYSLSLLVDAPGWANVHALYILQRRTLSAWCHRKPQDTHYGHCGGLVLQVPSPQKNLQIRSISWLRCLAQAKSCFRIPTKFKTSFSWKKLRNVRPHCVEPTCSSSTCMTSLFEKSFAGLQFCRWTEVNRTRSLVNNNLVLRPKISSTLKFRSHVLLRYILTSIVFVLLCMVPCANRAHGFYWCMCGGIRKSSHKLKYPKKMVFPQRTREKKAYAGPWCRSWRKEKML